MSLLAGHASVIISPTGPANLAGYYFPRESTGVHDDLAANALVLDDGETRLAMIAADVIHVHDWITAETRDRIQASLGVPAHCVLVNASHCHTGPVVDVAYAESLPASFARATEAAATDLRPVRVRVAHGELHGLSFNRRYWMSEGTVVTNPGKCNPEVVRPAGRYDPELHVVAFESNGGPNCYLVNFALHPDTVGGELISADWPGVVRRLLKETLGADSTVLFANGATGDVNHWDLSDPSPQRGFDEAERIGRAVAERALELLAGAASLDTPRLGAASEQVELPYQQFTADDVADAQEVLARPLDYEHDFTLDVVHAHKVKAACESGSASRTAEVQAFALGELALVGAPGEVFAELGQCLKERSPFAETIFVSLANDNVGYVPTRSAFDEGGYEVTSCRFAPGLGEEIVETGLGLLGRLHAR